MGNMFLVLFSTVFYSFHSIHRSAKKSRAYLVTLRMNDSNNMFLFHFSRDLLTASNFRISTEKSFQSPVIECGAWPRRAPVHPWMKPGGASRSTVGGVVAMATANQASKDRRRAMDQLLPAIV